MEEWTTGIVGQEIMDPTTGIAPKKISILTVYHTIHDASSLGWGGEGGCTIQGQVLSKCYLLFRVKNMC